MLGEYLRDIRTEAGLSQADVSKAMGYTTGQFVSNWERGVSAPPIHQIKRLAKVYEIDAQDLFNHVLGEYVNDITSKLERKFKQQKG